MKPNRKLFPDHLSSILHGVLVGAGSLWPCSFTLAHVSCQPFFLLAKGDFRQVQGWGTNKFKQSHWSKALNWSPRPLDEGPKPKSGKLRLNLTWHLFWRENQLVWTQKTVLKGELLIWRTKNQARDQGTVQLKDSICFKSVQIGS